MKLTKKTTILFILSILLLITESYVLANSVILDIDYNVHTNANINPNSSSSVIIENDNPYNIIGGTQNSDNNSTIIRKDYIQEYLSSLVKEKDNVEMYMNKIDGKKLLDAICKQQKSIESTKNDIAKMTIELVDWDISNPEERVVAEVTFNFEKEGKTVTVKNNVTMHTGMSMSCFYKKKDKIIGNDNNVFENGVSATQPIEKGDEFGFNMGYIKIALKGDLSGKAEIDVVDLSLMQQELVDEISLKDEFLVAADMDTSYEIDVIDLSMLQEYIVNN